MRLRRPPIYSLAFLLLFHFSASAGRVTAIFRAPQFVNVRQMLQDAAGNVYLAGAYVILPSTMPLPDQAVVSKLSPDGKVVFTTVFGGLQGLTDATAIALAPDGSIVVVGTTSSANFPITPDAAQTQLAGTTLGPGTGFFVRLDANGNIKYASYLNSGSQGLSPAFLVLDPAGNAYVSGSGNFTSTPGALPSGSTSNRWMAKIDTSGKLVFGTGLIGGAIALDASGSIYVAGSATPDQPPPLTSGAFQTQVNAYSCTGNAFVGFACAYQYVVKLDATASHVIYATWLSGRFGATPTSMAVDGAGNVIVAGTTFSADYPVTPGAYQQTNYSNLTPYDKTSVFGGLPIEFPVTGYVTKLNATGTALLFSTFLGGSGSDTIGTLATDASGNIYLGGATTSPDFPGLDVVPAACRPSFVYPTAYATRLSADGSALSVTQLANRLASLSYTPPVSPGPLAQIALDGAGKASAVVSGNVAAMDLLAAPAPLVCATDAGDYAPLTTIAPGQLLSLFGEGIGPEVPAAPPSTADSVPVALGGVSVTFNGTAAPILYAASGQVNVQVPYEVAGQSSVTMQINYTVNGSGTLAFTTMTSQPSVFVSTPAFATCGSTETSGVLPLAINGDFTVNSCANAAVRGSSIYLLLDGLGLAGGTPVTGLLARAATPLPTDFIASASTSDGRNVSANISITADTGQISGVWLAKIDLPSNVASPYTMIGLIVHGVSVREKMIIWTK